jgi:hypothetical protein
MRNRVLCVATGVVALSLSLVACSGGSSASSGSSGSSGSGGTKPAAKTSVVKAAKAGSGSAASKVDVCGLMTSAQATTLNHVTYGAATPQTLMAGYDNCTYKNTGKSESPVDIQDLTVSVESYAGCWSQLQKADGPGKPVAGVGDAAFGASIGLDIKVGDRCVAIQGLTGAELFGDYSRDTAMAKVILGNLH